MDQQVLDEVLGIVEKHKKTWRGKKDSHWYSQFSEEVGQLGVALITETDVDEQLLKVASITLNWLDARKERGDETVS